ncbi:lysine-rich nucleolar protein 1 isoform X2 [Caloenas nicobarica]|uniref:lysine-rich nucleolar protein 1 isoform X2 n=1 Tax=Caloenas nicobarica TaxID=187106 RepID=UPI0032B74649
MNSKDEKLQTESNSRMIIKKKGKGVPEEPVQKKKKVKSSKSQTIIEVEKSVQTDIGTEDDDQLETKTKVRKKEKLKEDECLDQLELKKKKKKKKNKKRKVGSKLLKEAHSESLVSTESHPDSEPQEESEEQIKILKKKKKKVQCHFSLLLENNQSSDVVLSNHATGGSKENEFPFKQSRRNTTLNLELDGEVTKKKKKGIFSFSLEDSEHKLCEKVHKKTHKHISPDKAFMGENHGTEIIQNDGESYVKRKKKKKKDKSDSFIPLTDNQHDINGVPYSPTALSDFRKRQRKNSQEITWTNTEEEDTTGNTGSIRETERKKRSKDVSSLPREGDQDCRHRAPDKKLPAQEEVESEEKELSGKKSRRNIKNNNEVIKKKKKVQKEEEEMTYSKVSINNNSASKSQKLMPLESNKKNKERGMKRAERVTGDGGDQVLRNSNHMLRDRKRKKRKKEVPWDFAEEPGSKANTQKIKSEEVGDEALEHVDDVTIVQEKKGNCDEVNIDKVRRQALQEEIDRESGKTKVFSRQAERDTRFGQWSTAAFQSPEQEMKFFRLMGGFKKGSAPPQNPSAAAHMATKALSRDGQDELQRNLEVEFQKAMGLKQHRGIGLGFQPAANKKAYIDKYASRSIKFED